MANQAERILNCIPSRDTEDDYVLDTALDAGLLRARKLLPESVDLREDWWTVGDQGATGSCVGWATADAVLRWHFVKAGKLDPAARLSVRFLWMAAKETDEFTTRPTTFIESDGTSLKAALGVARKYGLVKDEVLPFESGALYRGDARIFYAMASQLRISTYINLGRNLSQWRAWLAENGPILTRLEVDDTWYAAKANSGVLQTYDHGSAQGGHAVAIVGYLKDSFIVRNSWGSEDWGKAGFGFASESYAHDAFTEAYGVIV